MDVTLGLALELQGRGGAGKGRKGKRQEGEERRGERGMYCIQCIMYVLYYAICIAIVCINYLKRPEWLGTDMTRLTLLFTNLLSQ